MNGEGIHYTEHGSTSFVGADAVSAFRALSIASGLRFYAKTGMKINRAYTPSNMLRAATENRQEVQARRIRASRR